MTGLAPVLRIEDSMLGRVIFLAILSSLFFSCSSTEKKVETPEAAFAEAEEYDKAERYDEAIKRYQEVRNKFAYSRFAVKAALAVADAYFKQESYPEAQVSYQSFKDLYPKHPQIDYVTFQIAMSYYNQLPSTVDRDLTLAASAILHFEEVEARFPNSEHAPKARELKTESLKKLAGKEEYIADFYFRKKQYDSALGRYEGLLKRYPGLGFDARALQQSAISAARNGDLDKAKAHLQTLQQKFPDSPELAEARKEIR